MMPLAHELVAGWRGQHREPEFVIEPSVGSGGGARAAADGAVDLGMISRALTPDEQALGLRVLPIARDGVVLAAHRSVDVEGLGSDELVELFSGRVDHFADGTHAVPLLRDARESANQALERLVPALRQVREDAYRDHRLRVLYHDDAMGEALATTPGGIGVFDWGAVVTWRLPLRVLAIDGHRPSIASISDGSWKATRELAFVIRPDRLQRVAAFVAFVGSGEGQRITLASGYVPFEKLAP